MVSLGTPRDFARDVEFAAEAYLGKRRTIRGRAAPL